jgi:hypothetical protein
VGRVKAAEPWGLAVLRLQQSSGWDWTSVATIACIVVGVLLLAVFVRVEFRTEHPFHIMAGIMVATYLVAHLWLPKNRVSQEDVAGVSAPASPEAGRRVILRGAGRVAQLVRAGDS